MGNGSRSETAFSPIAIVGAAGVYPGAADYAAFGDLVLRGSDVVRDVPAERWIVDPSAGVSDALQPDMAYARRACFIDEFRCDPRGLEIDPELLVQLDPVFQLVLHAGRDALDAARQSSLDRDRVGVALAAIALPTDGSSAITREILGRDFQRRLLGPGVSGSALLASRTHPLNSRVVGMPAGLLARALGLNAGSFTLDAACASSLYAIKLACDALQSGRADAMLAGGVSRPESLYTQVGFSQLRALSRNGVCRPFDADADGLIVGEGAGFVVLKRLDDALANDDRILAVIRGIGLSNDLAGSLIAADSEGQLRAMRDAYRVAGWRPSDVDLIECHGTGTPLGDAVEFRSLRTLWGDSGWERGQCAIGSVKSQIGHLLTAAGIAAVHKVLQAFDRATVPPTANFVRPNPEIELDASPFHVPQAPRAWERRDAALPRRAAVSAFGFGGINAHLLLEEPGTDLAAPRLSDQDRPESRRQTHTLPPQAKSAPSRAPSHAEPIAIVGLAAQLGPHATPDALRRVLYSGTVPAQSNAARRWQGISPETVVHGRAGPSECAAIDALEVPVGRFRISPNEIPQTLPQQLLALQVVADALADAGSESTGPETRSGAFVGMGLDLNTSNYHLRWVMPRLARDWIGQLGLSLSDAEFDEWVAQLRDAVGPALNAPRVLGNLGGMIASRIAREFQFGGASFGVSSEETSGLRAADIALNALRTHELDRAVVCATDLSADVRNVICTAQMSDRGPNQYAVGEGAVALVLKRLVDAERDDDRIHAVMADVVMGSERAPLEDESAMGADLLIVDGPVAETPGLSAPITFRPASVIGDCGAVSGLAAMFAGALCLADQTVPVAGVGPRHWVRNRADGPRRTLVRSQGLDGTCATAVLVEYEPTDIDGPAKPIIGARARETSGTSDAHQLSHVAEARPIAAFAVLGADPAELGAGFDGLEALVARSSSASIERLAAEWHAMTRSADRSDTLRAASLVAPDVATLRSRLADVRQHLVAHADVALRRRGMYYSPMPVGADASVAFVYPGSGSDYPGMGAAVSRYFPGILRAQDLETARLADQLLPAYYANASTRGDSEASASAAGPATLEQILGQVAHGIVNTDLYRALGVMPSAAIGYSLGETASLFALRAWQDWEGMLHRLRSSPLFRVELAGPCDAARRAWKLPADEPVDWVVYAVNADAKRVRRALAAFERAALLIVNAPDECVVGGQRSHVRQVLEALGCESIPLHGASTVHCAIAEEVSADYLELHRLPVTAPADVRFYSAADASPYAVTTESAARSIFAQARDGFDFPQVINSAYDDGVRVFLECGPGASCTRMIRRILAGRPHLAHSICQPNEDGLETIINTAALLVAERVIPDLGGLYGEVSHLVVNAGAPAPTGHTVTVPIGRAPFAPPMPVVPTAVRDVSRETSQPTTAPVAAQPMSASRSVADSAAIPAVPSDLPREVASASMAVSAAHDRFLAFSAGATGTLSDLLAWQSSLLEQALGSESRGLPGLSAVASPTTVARNDVSRETALTAPHAPHHVAAPESAVAFTREQCMEFAIGKVGNVLGAMFADVDRYPVRVRLPDEPLMLVDRIVSITGEPGSLSSGQIVTEHDVHPGAWYLDNDRVPVCISVEAGQADLFLSSYLGIDLAVRGTRAYRLLDATIQFHRGLPRSNDLIRYDIQIDKFVRQGDAYLFFFRFEGTIDGAPFLSMTNGCAGFFTTEEIERSGGILLGPDEQAPTHRDNISGFRPLVAQRREAYDEARIDALRRGDLSACFGAPFDALPLQRPVRLPDGRMRLLHRVIDLDPAGGPFGLGRIRAEADIHPDDWFLTCHFVDDMVMPGTLMYECCAHTLRVLLLRLGWVAEHDQVAYEPVVGVPAKLKCRGPVTRDTRVVTYQVDVKEIGYRPEPYVIADALMLADGRPIVTFTDMSMQLTGMTREMIESVWNATDVSNTGGQAASATQTGQAAGATQQVSPIGDVAVSAGALPGLYTFEQIRAFANGRPSDAFGAPYSVFDTDRRIARLPGPPYQFLDRITRIDGCQPFVLEATGWIEGQYDVPRDAWYFAANRQASMPFAVLLEVALQPCGWLAAYLGSALRSGEDLSFRNLGGSATQLAEVFADVGTLTTRVRLTSVAEAGGMIIQKFDMQVWAGANCVYDGDTSFGFFTSAALADQVGIRGASDRAYVPNADELDRAQSFALPDDPPWTPSDAGGEPTPTTNDVTARVTSAVTLSTPAHLSGAAQQQMPTRAFRMVDQVDLWIPDGGPQGLGFIRGSKSVRPEEWFFQAHFYQDPVCPGSLGLESLLQLLKVVALHRWGGHASETHRFEPIRLFAPHTWIYRGQIIPANLRVEVDASITRIDDGPVPTIVADGFLRVDGKYIYEMTDFGVRMVPR